MISVLIFAVVLLESASGLQCPACDDDCKGAGFFSCEPCICNPTCTPDFCSDPNKECLMVEVQCYELPCAKLPNCIDVNKTCNGSPLRSGNGKAVVCNDHALQCPKDYHCTEVSSFQSLSVCCKGDIKAEKPEEVGVTLDWPLGGLPIIPDIVPADVDKGKDDKDDGDDEDKCEECLQDACFFLTCPNYPEAICVTDDCSCMSYFMDANQDKVFCEKPPEDKLSSEKPVFDLLSTTGDYPKVDESGGGSGDGGESSKVIIQQVIIASCVVFLFIVILLVTCKVIHWKRKTIFRKQQEEQLKPLRVGNNNKMDIA